MKTYNIIWIGIILCMAAFFFNSSAYLSSSDIPGSEDALKHAEDIMKLEVIPKLEECKNNELTQLVKASIRNGITNQQLSLILIKNKHSSAFIQMLLWVGVFVIFITLLLRERFKKN